MNKLSQKKKKKIELKIKTNTTFIINLTLMPSVTYKSVIIRFIKVHCQTSKIKRKKLIVKAHLIILIAQAQFTLFIYPWPT